MHFRHISGKIQPKNLKLIHYSFLTMRGNIRLGARDTWPSPWLRPGSKRPIWRQGEILTNLS